MWVVLMHFLDGLADFIPRTVGGTTLNEIGLGQRPVGGRTPGGGEHGKKFLQSQMAHLIRRGVLVDVLPLRLGLSDYKERSSVLYIAAEVDSNPAPIREWLACIQKQCEVEEEHPALGGLENRIEIRSLAVWTEQHGWDLA